jgi:hypothetical protein
MYIPPPQVFDQSQNVFYNQPQPIYGQPVYGQPMQPMYMQTPAPPIQQNPIIIINNNKGASGIHCQQCGHETAQIERKTIGCVAISWGVAYCCLTGIFCFLPCIQNRYKDTELVCIKCQTVKHTIPADCF